MVRSFRLFSTANHNTFVPVLEKVSLVRPVERLCAKPMPSSSPAKNGPNCLEVGLGVLACGSRCVHTGV